MRVNLVSRQCPQNPHSPNPSSTAATAGTADHTRAEANGEPDEQDRDMCR